MHDVGRVGRRGIPERLFLRQEFLPLLVDLALDTEFDLPQLKQRALSGLAVHDKSRYPTFSSSRRSCSSLSLTLWVARSSGRIEESVVSAWTVLDSFSVR